MKSQLHSGTVAASIDLPKVAILHELHGSQHPDPVQAALDSPLELPPVHECVVSGDSVAIAIDPQTPDVVRVVTKLWENLHDSTATELNVTLLLPADPSGSEWNTLLSELPVHINRQSAICIHDPDDEQRRSYLASSAGGDRIYLAHQLVDADLIVTIGTINFDPLLGYRGTNSAIYPWFSDRSSIQACSGDGHAELTPDDKRPLRELVDEIGWLLGTQFTIQVIPASDGSIAQVLCGAVDQVMKTGRASLAEQWKVAVNEHADLAVVSVPRLPGATGWRQLGEALMFTSNVVEDGGRIAVVAELAEPTSPALTMLRRCAEPDDILKPLSLEPTFDSVEVIQLIRALQRASIYLLSNLEDGVVEEFGLLPLSAESELQKLVDAAERPVVIAGANYSWPFVASATSV